MFIELKDRLAANVRRLQVARNWTQEDAAHNCEMPVRLLQGLEAGTDNQTFAVGPLAGGAGVGVQELLPPRDSEDKREN